MSNTPPRSFGTPVVVRGHVRYRVFCATCKRPFLWAEKPSASEKYHCEDHEGDPTPIMPPKAWGKGIKEEDGSNSFDDSIGMYEDGRS